MDLNTLTLKTSLKHVADVRMQMTDAAKMTQILDQARQETRVIDEILREMAMIKVLPSLHDEDQRQELWSIAMEHLVVLLALRFIEGRRPAGDDESLGSGVHSRIRFIAN